MAYKLRSIIENQKNIIVLSIILLILVTIFTSWCTNLISLTNADYLVYPYLFHDFSFHQIIVPLQHSNLLKYPLFILQSLLPYNAISVSIVNIALVVMAVLSWYVLTLYLLRWKYPFLISVVFAFILLGSPLFNYEILGSTIRNIEFPIALAFIISVSTLVWNGVPQKTTKRIALILIFLLYTLAVAGDSFFLYVVTTSIVLVAVGYGLTAKKISMKNLVMALSFVVASSLVGIGLRSCVQNLGIVTLYNDPTFTLQTISWSHIMPSISLAFQQLLDLFGANIFERSVDITLILPLVELLVVFLSLIGLVLIIVDSRTHKLKLGEVNGFALATISITSFVTFCIYVLSDLVVRTDASGKLISANQDRYLTFIVFISIIGVGYLLQRTFNKRSLNALFILILLTLAVSTPSIINNLRAQDRALAKPMDNSLKLIANTLKTDDIKLILSGYWYASPTKLFSNNTIDFAPVGQCNLKEPHYNVNLKWYIPTSNKKITSALLIDREGPDKIYWPCTDSQLESIYGKPLKVVSIQRGLSLHIYNYDLRTKLQ